jgi:hypothetical protein
VNINVVFRLKQAAEAKVAVDPGLVKLLLAGGAGALLGGGLGAHHAHTQDLDEQRRAKNVSFGAGVAAGLAGPRIVGGLNDRLNPQLLPAAAVAPEGVQ